MILLTFPMLTFPIYTASKTIQPHSSASVLARLALDWRRRRPRSRGKRSIVRSGRPQPARASRLCQTRPKRWPGPCGCGCGAAEVADLRGQRQEFFRDDGPSVSSSPPASAGRWLFLRFRDCMAAFIFAMSSGRCWAERKTEKCWSAVGLQLWHHAKPTSELGSFNRQWAVKRFKDGSMHRDGRPVDKRRAN